MNSKVDIIGPYPTPFGGISIHIQRIESYLIKEGISYTIYNHGDFSAPHIVATNKSPFWYLKYLFTHAGKLIHFHQFFKFHYVYYFIFALVSKKKIIVTIHEENILYYNRVLQSLVIFLLRNTRFSELITVSRNLSGFLEQNGVRNTWLPAYVPPLANDFTRLQPVPGKKYFLYSIWKVDRRTAESIYNVELAFRLLRKIKARFQMLFLIGTKVESDEAYLAGLQQKHSVEDSVTIIYEAQLTEYLKNCEFLLRTNLIDGYGVSLQEALSLGIPALASDVCARPKGTILFKTNNFDDLCDKVENLMKYWDPSQTESPDYHTRIIELYKKHLQ